MKHPLQLLTIIVVVTGIIAFIKISTTKGRLFPTTTFIIWLIASAILIGITIWSRMRGG